MLGSSVLIMTIIVTLLMIFDFAPDHASEPVSTIVAVTLRILLLMAFIGLSINLVATTIDLCWYYG